MCEAIDIDSNFCNIPTETVAEVIGMYRIQVAKVYGAYNTLYSTHSHRQKHLQQQSAVYLDLLSI